MVILRKITYCMKGHAMHEPCPAAIELPFLDFYRLTNRVMNEDSLSPEERERLIEESYGKYSSISAFGKRLSAEDYRRKLEETAADRYLAPSKAENFLFELLKERN